MYNFRTDMADERRDIYKKANNLESDIPGIQTIEKSSDENIKSSIVKILNEEGEKAIGKPIGTYVTFDVKNLKLAGENEIEKVSSLISEELKAIINEKISNQDEILVVGLGNMYVTPDALGPKVAEKIMITRHLKEVMPDAIDDSVRPVCAIAPGVLGITGIETGEVIKSLVDRIKPDLVICVDALGSRKLERVNRTIQIGDTGISPGAGVGNHRMQINEKSLGVKVLAVGVPTVVDAATIANDTMDLLLDDLCSKAQQGKDFYNMFCFLLINH